MRLESQDCEPKRPSLCQSPLWQVSVHMFEGLRNVRLVAEPDQIKGRIADVDFPIANLGRVAERL